MRRERIWVRHVVRAILFSIAINLLYFWVIPVVSGMILSYFYIPDIEQKYENVSYLQNEVSFGWTASAASPLTVSLYLLAGVGVYACGVFVLRLVRR
ncbi:hypothetical protein LOK74_23510 [Brevibacillus humidisoli]|uniref:hypothetical protein n=1 Tax=Brevibacillus humidisoli TaxID=2895522 RepID=UPI001E4D7AF0|nr:hypothetical protein [Brevibacillus humidisoli]UFJ40918.1 hypothetical protein LOK74_23510 [Brevibacillus humidisoli]